MRILHSLSAIAVSLFLFSGATLGADAQKLLKDTPFEGIVAKAKGGDGDAQMYLAKGHVSYGSHVPHNPQESYRWYVAAATNDVPDAQLYLGRHYYKQAVATKGITPKEKAARHQASTASLAWLLKAAKQGSIDAFVELGEAFDDGRIFAKDPVEAYKWYHLAIEKRSQPIGAPVKSRNALSLILTPAQIELAKRRALDFWESLGEERKPTAPK